MENFVKYNKLFDCYSKLLTKKEINCFKDYYEEDLSLQEIAENNNVSRSAVHKTIKNVTEKLEDYENKLGLCKLIEQLEEIESIDDIIVIKEKISEILKNL